MKKFHGNTVKYLKQNAEENIGLGEVAEPEAKYNYKTLKSGTNVK